MEKNIQTDRNLIENINSLLLVLYLYSSVLTLPLKELTDSGIFLWTLTLLILGTSLYINKFRINKKVFAIILIVLFIFILNYFLLPYKYETAVIFTEFLKFGIIPLFLASFVKKADALLKFWYMFGIISFIIWFMFLPEINNRDLNYMTFGRHMSLSFLVFTIYFYSGKKKLISFLLMLASIVLIVLLANRSVILISIAIIIFFELRSLKNKTALVAYVRSVIYLILITILIFRIEKIILFINDLLLSFGINSYAMTKAIFLLRDGFLGASSGRDKLFEQSLELIKSNNYMPNGIGFYQNITGIVYPHNIFLDILLSFGIFGLLLMLFFFGLGTKKFIGLQDQSLRIIIFSLFIYTSIILNFSGMFWSEEVLWVIIGLLITKHQNKDDFTVYQYSSVGK